MLEIKSLVESRAFWSAVLGLAAIVATSFHLTAFAAWAVDPATLDAICNGVAMLAGLMTIVFRVKATAQVTSLLPPAAPGKTSAHAALPVLLVLPLVAALLGCNLSAAVSDAETVAAKIDAGAALAAADLPMACALVGVVGALTSGQASAASLAIAQSPGCVAAKQGATPGNAAALALSILQAVQAATIATGVTATQAASGV